MGLLNKEDCNHVWTSQEKENGGPDFRMNRQMSNKPLLHATCRDCNARTWFTEEQWFAMSEVE